MKLTVLVDNHTYIDQYYGGEPAVCYYIEDAGQNILFDAGYSDLCLRNALQMGIDLRQLDTVVFSHGHNDHTRGFRSLNQFVDLAKTTIVAHPLCFQPKREQNQRIGAPFDRREMAERFQLKLSAAPLQISPHLTFLGQIPAYHWFEPRTAIGVYQTECGQWQEDRLLDDSALACQTDRGLFLVTGCSHSGICNIISYAKQVCKEERVLGVIGGFHLFERDLRLRETISYFQRQQMKQLYPCHCVSFQAKVEIHAAIPIGEVGVGLSLEL